MSDKYLTTNPEGIYYVTLTVVDWVDVFTRPVYKEILIDSLKYCQIEKGLIIYAWCLMSNHIHMIISAKQDNNVSDILRDFKKFTSKRIVKTIKKELESRKDWMLYRFEFAGKFLKRIKNYKFWQDGNHAKQCVTNSFIEEKLSYIHNNPVRAMIVSRPEDYLLSSAINYTGKTGLIDVCFIE